MRHLRPVVTLAVVLLRAISSTVGLRAAGDPATDTHELPQVSNPCDGGLIFFCLDDNPPVLVEPTSMPPPPGSNPCSSDMFILPCFENAPIVANEPARGDAGIVTEVIPLCAEMISDAETVTLDTDSDGISDDCEPMHRTNPDTDGDGLSDGDEINVYETAPTARDSDGDCLIDGVSDSTDEDPWDPANDSEFDYAACS